MADDQAGGGHVAPVRDDHCATPLPVIGDDLAIVVPEHKGRVQVQWASMDDAGQVDGGALLDISLFGSQDLCLGLNDSKIHSVLQMGCRAHLHQTTIKYKLRHE